jgi:ribosomal protein S18 acetylase RimI-like enzyme
MSPSTVGDDHIDIPTGPAIPGLRFRHFRGETDFPQLLAVLRSSEHADGVERPETVDELAGAYRRMRNCDPYLDLVLAEIDSGLIGYARGAWYDEPATGRIFDLTGFLAPNWRRRGIGRAMLTWLEDHLRAGAAAQAPDRSRWFSAVATQRQLGLSALLERAGYRPVRYYLEMVRRTLDDIPDAPLPAGLELRPVRPEHYRAIWAQVDETSQDEWGYTPATEEGYTAWLASAQFQPHLWQVAWEIAADRVVGTVLSYIDAAENEANGRLRGYTEGIGVVRDWRRQGVAGALITRSLRAQRQAGMTESALVPESESGAIGLYERYGFGVVKRDVVYRKRM